MNDLSIREFVPEKNPADMERLLPAYLQIWTAEENRKFLSLTRQPFDATQARAWFSDHLRFGVRYFAAMDPDDRIVGILITRSTPAEGFETMSIAVPPREKRQGIGRLLLRHALDVAAREGYQAVEARVFADNNPILRLLMEFSFTPVRMEHRKGADGVALLHLKRSLEPEG